MIRWSLAVLFIFVFNLITPHSVNDLSLSDDQHLVMDDHKSNDFDDSENDGDSSHEHEDPSCETEIYYVSQHFSLDVDLIKAPIIESIPHLYNSYVPQFHVPPSIAARA